MSALTSSFDDLRSARPARQERPALRVVPLNPMRVPRTVFIAFLTLLMGAGMVGVLVLNTTIQQRQTAVTRAQRQADDLAWRQASMTAQVEQLRSSSDLATRAWALGMRPNPHPVFVVLDGQHPTVMGTPTPVTGTEMPDQAYANADEVAAAIDKAHAAAVERRTASAEKRRAEAKAAAEKKAAEKKAAAAKPTATQGR